MFILARIFSFYVYYTKPWVIKSLPKEHFLHTWLVEEGFALEISASIYGMKLKLDPVITFWYGDTIDDVLT